MNTGMGLPGERHRWIGMLHVRPAASVRIGPQGEIMVESLFVKELDFTIALRHWLGQPDRCPLVRMEWRDRERPTVESRWVSGVWECQVIGCDKPKNTSRHAASYDRIWIGAYDVIRLLKLNANCNVDIAIWELPTPVATRRETLWEGI